MRARSSIMDDMNKLTTQKRVAVVRCLVEGCSIRSTVRMTGVGKQAIMRLIVDMGEVCRQFHDERVRSLKTARVQCDEEWAFVGAKQKQVERGAPQYGDAWLWLALDADTKLAITWAVGGRDEGTAFDFIHDLAGRLNSRVQLTTDGLNSYLGPIMDAFGPYVDYAQLVKLYGDDPRLKKQNPEATYSPARICGCRKQMRIGTPDQKHISTSFIERQNLTVRMSCRRFTRLTNAFSKKILNHEAAISLHYCYYNWCRVHQTLRCTPAMEAGLTTTVWEIEDLVGLLEKAEQAKIDAGAFKRGPYKKTKA
ncbi:MAG: IS1 family transposase [Phycisphaeraceae bacterium]|nr:IS1 family transposase [Phycisphaeraceae bacterium]